MPNQRDKIHSDALVEIKQILGSDTPDHARLVTLCQGILADTEISMDMRATVCITLGGAYQAEGGEDVRALTCLTEAWGLALMLPDTDVELLLSAGSELALAEAGVGNAAAALEIITRITTVLRSESFRGTNKVDASVLARLETLNREVLAAITGLPPV